MKREYEDWEGFGIGHPIHLPSGGRLLPFVGGESVFECGVLLDRMICEVVLRDQLVSSLKKRKNEQDKAIEPRGFTQYVNGI